MKKGTEKILMAQKKKSDREEIEGSKLLLGLELKRREKGIYSEQKQNARPKIKRNL